MSNKPKSNIKILITNRNNNRIRVNDEFEDDDNENDFDETFLAKFLIRQTRQNVDLVMYMDEIGFYEESDIPYLDKDDWEHICLLLHDKRDKAELIKMLLALGKIK